MGSECSGVPADPNWTVLERMGHRARFRAQRGWHLRPSPGWIRNRSLCCNRGDYWGWYCYRFVRLQRHRSQHGVPRSSERFGEASSGGYLSLSLFNNSSGQNVALLTASGTGNADGGTGHLAASGLGDATATHSIPLLIGNSGIAMSGTGNANGSASAISGWVQPAEVTARGPPGWLSMVRAARTVQVWVSADPIVQTG